MSDDEQAVFLSADLSPDVEVKNPSIQQIAESAGMVAVETAKEFPPAAALATLKIAVKVMSMLIDRNLVEKDAKSAHEHAEAIATAISPTFHTSAGDG